MLQISITDVQITGSFQPIDSLSVEQIISLGSNSTTYVINRRITYKYFYDKFQTPHGATKNCHSFRPIYVLSEQ